MDLLPPLEADDLHQVLLLLARLATSTDPVPARKCQLAEGLARLVAADVWLWARGRSEALVSPPTDYEDPVLCCGCAGPAQKTRLLRALEHRGWRSLCRRALVASKPAKPASLAVPAAPVMASRNGASPRRRHVTCARRELVADADWYNSPYYLTRHAPAGVDDFVLSAYPLYDAEWSTLAFWRRPGAPPFCPRDRHVVHLVTSEIDGLHRLPNEFVPANGGSVTLSPRQRQVLQLLLTGNGNKAIAGRLKLSQHTVCDYIKQLHRRFKVNSRCQLLARFVVIRGHNGRR